MKAIEMETVIPPDGKLPSSFQEVFGRKARVIVLFEEDEPEPAQTEDASARLMKLAGKIRAFQDVEDPVAFQRQWRDEWIRGSDQ